MSKWTKKRFDEVIRKWKANEINLADAASELIWLGIYPDSAWKILENT